MENEFIYRSDSFIYQIFNPFDCIFDSVIWFTILFIWSNWLSLFTWFVYQFFVCLSQLILFLLYICFCIWFIRCNFDSFLIGSNSLKECSSTYVLHFLRCFAITVIAYYLFYILFDLIYGFVYGFNSPNQFTDLFQFLLGFLAVMIHFTLIGDSVQIWFFACLLMNQFCFFVCMFDSGRSCLYRERCVRWVARWRAATCSHVAGTLHSPALYLICYWKEGHYVVQKIHHIQTKAFYFCFVFLQ